MIPVLVAALAISQSIPANYNYTVTVANKLSNCI